MKAKQSKVQSIGNKQNQVRMVQPIATENDSVDDENNSESEHLRTYRTIMSLVNLLANIVGVSAYRDIEVNFRLIFTIFMICVIYPSLFYTIAVVWSSVSTLLEVICIFGVLLPATLKFRLILKDVKHVLSMNSFFEKILIDIPKGRRADHLETEMKAAFNYVKMFIAISLLCFAIFSLYPIYVFINESRLIPIMRIEFPFLDQTNMKGYLVGLAVMLIFAILGVAGSVAFDLMVLQLLLQYGSLVTQLILDFEDYHEIWENKEEFPADYRERFLKNILFKYEDINCYIRYFNKLFSANTCQSICILYGSLICSVYAVFNNGWISGYGFCIFCFVQLYIPCILGTYVANQNARMNQAIYFTPWYEYPIQVQKTILILLHASSFNTMELWIGPFAPQNVQTALQLTKSIYLYYTAMCNLE